MKHYWSLVLLACVVVCLAVVMHFRVKEIMDTANEPIMTSTGRKCLPAGLKAYELGASSRRAGADANANPYVSESSRCAWLDGWIDAAGQLPSERGR